MILTQPHKCRKCETTKMCLPAWFDVVNPSVIRDWLSKHSLAGGLTNLSDRQMTKEARSELEPGRKERKGC